MCPYKLETLRLKDYKESNTFFTEFEKLINELKSVGATVTEREKLKYAANAARFVQLYGRLMQWRNRIRRVNFKKIK